MFYQCTPERGGCNEVLDVQRTFPDFFAFALHVIVFTIMKGTGTELLAIFSDGVT
jgi:hypothetical protein